MLSTIKISTHVRAALTAALVIFVGTLFKQPQMVAWIQSHWLASDFITAASTAYGVYITYAQPVSSQPEAAQQKGV